MELQKLMKCTCMNYEVTEKAMWTGGDLFAGRSLGEGGFRDSDD